MIRINLLGVERQKVKKAAPSFDIGQRLTVLCSLILVASLLGIGWWWWSLTNTATELDGEIARSQREAQQLRSLLNEVKTFDFFKATASSDQMDRIMLSGGASRVDGFREMLQERFNAPVEDFDPFRAVTWDKKLPGEAEDMAATAAVAVGLALRKVSDR